MRIPLVDKIGLLLRPRAETEFERAMMMIGLQDRASRAFTWSRFGAVALVAMLLGAAQWQADEELHCLALTIYFEARGESMDGQIAVGKVVMNRVADRRFPGNVCDVVRHGGRHRENCQFSWYCDRLSDRPGHDGDWQAARRLAYSVYWDKVADPTEGALWYHAVYVKPIWRRKLQRIGRIGQHIFYRDPVRNRTTAS